MSAVEPIEFTVPGEPVVKARHRARVVTNAAGKSFATMYQPERGKTARFEERVRLCAINAGVRLLEGAVGLDIRAYWPTKGAPRKNTPRPECWKATRPDVDNLVKSVADGLNGTAYADDAQVVSVVAQKLHAAQGEAPRVVVRVIPLGG